MKDYKEVLKEFSLVGVKSTHIRPDPRWDLQKAYVFTKDILTEQIRSDLEEIIGITPDISNHCAIQSILYVLPTELSEKVPEEAKNELKQLGYKNINAVFIRGATNPIIARDAYKEAGDILEKAFHKLKEKYGKRFDWHFTALELDTCKVLMNHNLELSKMEY